MDLTTAAVLAVTATANIAIAVADLARAEFVLANSAEVEVPESWLPRLAVLKSAGGLGILLWFLSVPLLPALAATGLVCFFIGAIVTHVRSGVFYNLAFPGAYLALAVASLVLILATGRP